MVEKIVLTFGVFWATLLYGGLVVGTHGGKILSTRIDTFICESVANLLIHLFVNLLLI